MLNCPAAPTYLSELYPLLLAPHFLHLLNKQVNVLVHRRFLGLDGLDAECWRHLLGDRAMLHWVFFPSKSLVSSAEINKAGFREVLNVFRVRCVYVWQSPSAFVALALFGTGDEPDAAWGVTKTSSFGPIRTTSPSQRDMVLR